MFQLSEALFQEHVPIHHVGFFWQIKWNVGWACFLLLTRIQREPNMSWTDLLRQSHVPVVVTSTVPFSLISCVIRHFTPFASIPMYLKIVEFLLWVDVDTLQEWNIIIWVWQHNWVMIAQTQPRCSRWRGAKDERLEMDDPCTALKRFDSLWQSRWKGKLWHY